MNAAEKVARVADMGKQIAVVAMCSVGGGKRRDTYRAEEEVRRNIKRHG